MKISRETFLGWVAGFFAALRVTAQEKHPVILSAESFARTTAFIDQTARPLERALLEFRFGHGSRDAVIAELAKVQNTDGGFATCLDGDVRWRGSSAMGTMLGLRILNRMKAPSGNASVQAAVRYLLASFDDKKGYWNAVPAEVNRVPHAPWWQVHEDSGKCEVESPVFPTAALAGYLQAYPPLLPGGFLSRITKSSLDYLSAAPVKMQMPDVEMLTEFVRLLPEDHVDKREAIRKMRNVLAAVVVRDPREWSNYGVQPLTFVHTPDSPFYAELESEVAANLDYVIASQQGDGGWALTWSWEKSDPVAWELAKKEWRGVVALENLEKLDAFHRIGH